MIIDGKKLSEKILSEVKQEVIEIKKSGKTPVLSVILIGEYPPSQIYVKNKEKMAKQVGINSEVIHYEQNVKQSEVIEKIRELNNDPKVSGILVQLPLPKHFDKEKIINSILPSKDVDGFHPVNVGGLASGYDSIVPCTPLGCLLILRSLKEDLNGKHAVIIGRSNLNGKPMAQLLLKENCTVTILHSKTKNLKAECIRADILIAAVGVKEMVKGDWIKKNAIVIDIGINKVNGKLFGDVDFENSKKNAKAITPVPGGVGPMTIACLLKNTIKCFKKSNTF